MYTKYPEKLILVLFSFLCTFDVEDIKQKTSIENLLGRLCLVWCILLAMKCTGGFLGGLK